MHRPHDAANRRDVFTLAQRERQHYEVVAHWVRRSLCHTSGDNMFGKGHRTFLKYLKDVHTMDLVYMAIIDRVQRERAPSDRFLQQAVSLLKRFLRIYVPKPRTLLRLDKFCSSVVSHNDSIIRSFAFLRSLIHCRRQMLQRGRDIGVLEDGAVLDSEAATPESAVIPDVYSGRRPLTTDFFRYAVVTSSIADKSHTRLFRIPPDFATMFEATTESTTSNASSSSGQTSNIFINVYSTPMVERVNVVEQHMQEVRMQRGDTPKQLQHKKGVNLFQYKYYHQQEALHMEPQEKFMLLEFVSEAMSDAGRHFLSAKVLLKLLLDTYSMIPLEEASQQILGIFFYLMSKQDPLSRMQAFNLLLNLSVHVNLLDAVPVFGDEEVDVGVRQEMSAIQAQLFTLFVEMALRLVHLGEHNEDVWSGCLNCMLYFVVTAGEVNLDRLQQLDPRVLVAFLQRVPCLSDMVQSRLIRMLCNVVLVQHSTRNEVRLDVDKLLWACESFDFILDLYTRTRSIEAQNNLFFVIFEYVTQKLREQSAMKKSAHATRERQQSRFLLTTLFEMDAARTFQQFFYFVHAPSYIADSLRQLRDTLKTESSHGSEERRSWARSRKRGNTSRIERRNARSRSGTTGQRRNTSTDVSPLEPVTEGFTTDGGDAPNTTAAVGLSTERKGRQQQSHQALRQLDFDYVAEWVSVFHNLAVSYLKVDAEFEVYRDQMFLPGSLAAGMAALNELLHSPFEADRHQGQNWLFQLVQSLYERQLRDAVPSKGNASGETPTVSSSRAKLRKVVDEVMAGLLTSPEAKVRHVFIHIVRRAMFFLKAKTADSDRGACRTAIVDLITMKLNQVVEYGETNPSNLMALFDVIVQFVSKQSTTPGVIDMENATTWSLFLGGHVQFSHHLVAVLPVDPLRHIMMHLPPVAYASVRVVLLLLLMRLCHPAHAKSAENFRAVGGEPFFVRLVTGADPDLAYHAARFFSEYIRAKEPEQYQEALRTLLTIIPEDKSGIDFFHVLALMGQYKPRRSASRRSAPTPSQ